MNEQIFGIQQQIFAAVPDTGAYFSTQQMETAQQSIEQTVRRGDGISLVIGYSGVGKTLLLRLLRKRLKPEFTVASISNGKLNSSKDFLRQLSFELHMPSSNYSENDELQLRFNLLEFAKQEPTQGIVILVDESQYLDSSVLEEIRLLMNTDDGSKSLFRVVLAGTLEFEEKLTLTQLAAFDQRITSRIYLDTLTFDETLRYIDRKTTGTSETDIITESSKALNEYISLSGKTDINTGVDGSGEDSAGNRGEIRRFDSAHINNGNTVFTEEAKRLVYRYSEGLPRLINQICRSAIELAAEQTAPQIDGQVIQIVWNLIQHIESENISEIKPEVSVISSADEAVIEEKKKTLQLKEFDSVLEFGLLEDETDGKPQTADDRREEIIPAEIEPQNTESQCYKPPYPMDFEEDAADTAEPSDTHLEISAEISADASLILTGRTDALFCKPVRKKNYRWDGKRKYQKRKTAFNENNSDWGKKAECLASLSLIGREFITKTGWIGNVSGRNLFYPARCCSFGFVPLSDAGNLIENPTENPDMDAETLQKYGEEILNDRPPFVRKEPRYAYDIIEETFPVSSVLPVVWQIPEPADGAGIATAYRDFAERQTEQEKTEDITADAVDTVNDDTAEDITDGITEENLPAASEMNDTPIQEEIPVSAVETAEPSNIVRLILGQINITETVGSLSIDEDFDETVEVGQVSAQAPMGRTNPAVLKKPNFDLAPAAAARMNPNEYIITQQALESVVRRITEAAEIIEYAADVSKTAGTHISGAADMSRESVIKFRQTADLVQEEVMAVIPNYKELFQELSEFQETVSQEMRRIKTDHHRFSETMRNVPFMKEYAVLENTANMNEAVKKLPIPKRSGFVPNSDSVCKKTAEFKVSE